MTGAYFNVSGVNPNDGAKVVFVWGHDKASENPVLIGSGHVVGSDACGLPPGIEVGQFSVTFKLPPGCSADHLFVTDDKNGKVHLQGVKVIACSVPAWLQSESEVPSDKFMVSPVSNAG